MRLIDADELKEAMEEHTDYKGYLVCDPEEIIDLAPTVEQRPHGEWKQVTAKDGEYYCYHQCTNCGQTIESGFDNPPLFNFCPNCGADMRGEAE